MVSVIEDFQKFIVDRKQKLLDTNSLESYCYFYLAKTFGLVVDRPSVSLSSILNSKPLGEDGLAKLGYLGIFEDEPFSSHIQTVKTELQQILRTKPLAGMHYSLNVFTLLGIYLLADRLNLKNVELMGYVERTLKDGSFKDKFLVSIPQKQFDKLLTDDSCQSLSDCLINYLIGTAKSNSKRKKLSEDVVKFWNASALSSLDSIDIFLIEYWLTDELKKTLLYKEHSSLSLIKEILSNFSNSITKITKSRRKNHPPFEINDEYDVQDLIYLMLKPIFKDLKEEEYTPKTGGKSTRIDLVLPTEVIVIETKMIKDSDMNEDKFIKEIKEDIQSYYKYPNLKWLIVFVYDPFRKTRDDNNFYDLNGLQRIKDKEFEVYSIITH